MILYFYQNISFCYLETHINFLQILSPRRDRFPVFEYVIAHSFASRRFLFLILPLVFYALVCVSIYFIVSYVSVGPFIECDGHEK